MKRSVWKWIFGISLVLFILHMVYYIFALALNNFANATWVFLMEDAVAVESVSLAQSLRASVGSPWFYRGVFELAAMVISLIALIVTRKQKCGKPQEC